MSRTTMIGIGVVLLVMRDHIRNMEALRALCEAQAERAMADRRERVEDVLD